jgi:hypothetical protein
MVQILHVPIFSRYLFEMKNLYLVGFLFQIALLSSAQESMQRNSTFKKGDLAVSYGFAPGFQHQQHQLTVDYFVGDSWSLVYRGNLSIAQSNLYASEYVLPIGATVGAGVASLGACGTCSGYCSFDDGFGLVAASFMIPDGVSYHMYPLKNVAVSPYIIFSGLGIYQTNENTDFFYSPSVGIRFSLSTDSFPFGAFLDPQVRAGYDGFLVPQVLGGLMVRF